MVTRNIYGYKCRKCGHLHYPFRMVCKKCGKNGPHEFDTEPLPKKGKILTFTTAYNLAAEFEVATLTFGIVELDNGIRMLGQVRIPEPRPGMKVKGEVEVVRKCDYDGYYGMVFYKA